MRSFRLCAQCTRQRKKEYEDSWLCPYKGRIVYLDTDAESCEGFMLPLGHDKIWNNNEGVVLDI